MITVVLAVVLAVVVPAAPVPPAEAAVVGEYSEPEWLPVRRSITGAEVLQGCTYQSPAPACWLRETNHHPYWALDLLTERGTPVYAAGKGRVAQLRKGEPPCGAVANFVDIDHDPGSGGLWSDYWHLDQVFVEVGQWVDENTVIGTVGDTGMNRAPEPNGYCGAHLHYEELMDWWPNRVDPGRLLACHGDELLLYPQAVGFGTWQGMRWGTFSMYSDGTGCTSGPFTDVGRDHPFVGAITWMVGQGITTGYGDGSFRPTEPVSRQAVAAFLARAAGVALPACTSAQFSDVGAGHVFCPAIAWMVGQGITTGYGDGSFRPTEPVSRQAVAAFLARAAGVALPACTSAQFSDVGAGHVFCPAIAWMVGQGITTGYGDGSFRPTEPVSRQAVAAFLHRSHQG